MPRPPRSAASGALRRTWITRVAVAVGAPTLLASPARELAQPGDDGFAAQHGPFAAFVEPGFPFFGTTVDASGLGLSFPARNVTPRGLVLMLGDSTYATFDPDLLRMAVAWRGDFISLTTMAQVSYQKPLQKDNAIPRVLGRPVLANGIYPGWMVGTPDFRDPRLPGPWEPEVGRGPIPSDLGRWNGLYVNDDKVVLSYTVRGTEVLEQPGSVRDGSETGFVRTFRTSAITEALTLVVAEVAGSSAASISGNTLRIPQPRDSLFAVGIVDAPRGARLELAEGRYVILRLPAGGRSELFRAVVWRGPSSASGAFSRMLRGRTRMAEFAAGGPAHWRETVATVGTTAPDSAAYVVDRLTLPLPNPWLRNVRPADVDFFSDGRAAVVTFEGDVWIVTGIDRHLGELRWKRFASGLYEPLNLSVVNDRVYVYSRDGVVRLHDLNADGEADFYENFSNLVITTTESREFPLGMEPRPGGGFYLTRGGALDNGPRTSPATFEGFRAGSDHAGTVMELSPDGRSLRVVASGFREPFLGVHPQRGMVTASDQEGNFVPSTPIYLVRDGGYYGVPATAHRKDVPARAVPPLVWIPHAVDPSATGQAWITGGRMGFGGDALLHISYGRPGVFQIFVDSTAGGVHGALVSLVRGFTAPLLNGGMNPRDGQLYVAGFQIYGSRARETGGLIRVRHTGRASYLPRAVEVGEQGVLIRFQSPLDSASVTDPGQYRARRWNYRRTQDYGSGYFKLDGSPGQDELRIGSAHLSPDGRSLLLVIADMREVMQMQVEYEVTAKDGKAVADTLYLTVNHVPKLNLAAAGLGDVSWRASIAAVTGQPRTAAPGQAPSAARGAEILRRNGCIGCHSVDGSTAGKVGPTLKGLYGTVRTFRAGPSRPADEGYLREAIRDPAAQVVEGFSPEMPPYEGVLAEDEIESLVLYIRSLSGSPQLPSDPR